MWFWGQFTLLYSRNASVCQCIDGSESIQDGKRLQLVEIIADKRHSHLAIVSRGEASRNFPLAPSAE